MHELRTVVTNLKSLRHSQIEFKKKNQVIATKFTTTTKEP